MIKSPKNGRYVAFTAPPVVYVLAYRMSRATLSTLIFVFNPAIDGVSIAAGAWTSLIILLYIDPMKPNILLICTSFVNIHIYTHRCFEMVPCMLLQRPSCHPSHAHSCDPDLMDCVCVSGVRSWPRAVSKLLLQILSQVRRYYILHIFTLNTNDTGATDIILVTLGLELFLARV